MAVDLRDLERHFDAKIDGLKNCLELKSAVYAGEESREILRKMCGELDDLEDFLEVCDKEQKEEKEKLEEAKKLKDVLQHQNEMLEYIAANLPSRLPGDQKITTKQQPQFKAHTGPVQSETQTFRLQVKQQSVGSSDVAPVKRPSKNALMNVPKIPYLTLDEFSEVPKYMKNRLSYDQVNMTVDDLHRVMVAKYKLLATPRSSLGEPAMKKYKAFKSQENEDTAGHHFVVDEDIRSFGCGLKLDSACRSVLTVLRHCGRLRESRGGGITRYIVV